jgi:peptidyl-prolyl cis-trans isomerase SurA
VAQILFRKVADNPEKNAQLKMRADSVASALLNGSAKWDEACTAFSDDKATTAKQGYLGFFGINRYAKAFEDAAFGIEKDGSVSRPVETTIGFHIIKRISQRGIGAFESARKSIAERVKRDSRSELARQSIISRIQREGNYKSFPEALKTWSAKQVDSIFLTFRWRPDSTMPKTPIMQYGSSDVYTVADFEEYCAKASRERMRGAGYPIDETISKLFKAWSDDVALLFEENQLDKKYPDFRSLMREYEEGILLFEALKINVWDRANTDSVGLEKFYTETLKDKYKWDERARVSLYTLKTDDPKTIEKLRKLAAKKPSADVLKKMNKKAEVVTVIEKLYEKGKNRELGTLWSAGAMTDAKPDAGTKTATFFKIEEIVPPTAKKLSEARGYAVADYQDYLEKQWVAELRNTYKVQLNETAFKALIKK